MNRPELSPAVMEILRRRDAVAEDLERTIHEYESATESEAELTGQYKREYAEAFLVAKGPVRERECRADLSTSTTFTALQVAIALRRSAKGALDVRQRELEVLQAALHCHNREMKVLGG